MPELIPVGLGRDQRVMAMLYQADLPGRVGVTLVLAPGAGAGQTSEFMVSFATGLAARGVNSATFNFLYLEQGRRLPDVSNALEGCWRAALEAIRHHPAVAHDHVVIGGKSMGGRIATHLAAAGADVAAVVLLGYPLHPPGQPEKLRSAHLERIRIPMLFVQGSRDPFGTPEELRPIIDALPAPATLHVIEGGDHSFKVPKRLRIGPDNVRNHVLDRIVDWLHAILRPPTAGA
jgi:predicted alpha/beta-hydrolase family hydrolase